MQKYEFVKISMLFDKWLTLLNFKINVNWRPQLWDKNKLFLQKFMPFIAESASTSNVSMWIEAVGQNSGKWWYGMIVIRLFWLYGKLLLISYQCIQMNTHIYFKNTDVRSCSLFLAYGQRYLGLKINKNHTIDVQGTLFVKRFVHTLEIVELKCSSWNHLMLKRNIHYAFCSCPI